MIELVYDKAAWEVIKQRFPNAQMEDASDEIHESRIQVILPDADRDAFYKHAIREGYYEVCFGFQIMARDEKGYAQIKKWIEELKAEKAAEEAEAAKKKAGGSCA